jgi:hypothetical protein
VNKVKAVFYEEKYGIFLPRSPEKTLFHSLMKEAPSEMISFGSVFPYQ